VRFYGPRRGIVLSSGAAARTDCCVPDPVALQPWNDLIDRLRELSLVVDMLSKDALNRPGEGRVLEVLEASQGLHRAIIALDSFFAS